MAWDRGKLTTFLCLFQLAFFILFITLVQFDSSAQSKTAIVAKWETDLPQLYPMFTGVHIMVFVGFGFLMTFLGRYSFSSLGLNMLIAAFVIEWSTIFWGFFYIEDYRIKINLPDILNADFCCVAVLISFGATIGRMSALQLVIMSFIETILYSFNFYIGSELLRAPDVGGSMYIHLFGAYFGLSLSRALWTPDVDKQAKKLTHSYNSDVSSMIGTQFLWICWPSFNAAIAPGDNNQRAVMNTYYSLAACVVMTFAISSIVHWKHNCIFDMEHIQNSTLAGGVAVGTVADMLIDPWAAILIGMTAGTVSVLGFKYLTPWMNKKLKIADTCGIHNLHAMPALIASWAGFFASGAAGCDRYGTGLYDIWPAMGPLPNQTVECLGVNVTGIDDPPGLGRSSWTQGGFQLAAMFTTLGFAIIGGTMTGIILRLPIYNQPFGESLYDDTDYWSVPTSGFPDINDMGHHVPSYLNKNPQLAARMSAHASDNPTFKLEEITSK